MAVIEVTDATFDQVVLQATKPVLVDYWADWCVPCKKLAPVLTELSEVYGDRLLFVKLDTNVNQQVPTKRGIMSLPTLEFFFNGEVIQSLQGGTTKTALTKVIESIV